MRYALALIQIATGSPAEHHGHACAECAAHINHAREALGWALLPAPPAPLCRRCKGKCTITMHETSKAGATMTQVPCPTCAGLGRVP
jgi:DnaJ-class molecular chaperone